MSKNYPSLISLALAALLSYGCASPSVDTMAPADKASAEEKTLAASPKEEPSYPIRPFSTDTLYDLLVGELAGIRNNFEIAQDKYLTQARQTHDPAVVERAAQIAAFTENKAALLEMSLLWVAVEPENLEAHSLAAMSLSHYGRYQEALTHAEFALARGVNEPLMNLVISANSANTSQREQMLQQISELEAQQPNNTFLLLAKAMLQRQQKRLPEALSTVSQLLDQDSSLQPAIMLKAQLLYRLGKKQEASAFLEQSLAGEPNNKRMRLQYARFLADDDLPAAHQQLSILAKKYPGDPELIYSLALASKGLGNDAEAIELFTQLTRHPATAYSAHYELGLMAEKAGDIEAVLMHYRQVHSGPKFFPAATRLSRFMADHGQLDEARLYLQKIRLEHPHQSSRIYQIESELLAEQQRLDEAYSVLSDAIRLEPSNIQLLYMRSLLSERQNDYVRSEQDLRTILEQDSDNAMALNALGYTLTVHTDRYEEAHQLITRALELNPGDPATIDSLGWVSYQLGNYDDAIKYLRQALDKLPDPEVASHLGEVLWVTGQQQEAKAVWQTILENDPDNAMIKKTMERLGAE